LAKTRRKPSDNFKKLPSSVTRDSRRRGFTSTSFKISVEAGLAMSAVEARSLLRKTLALGVLATVLKVRFLWCPFFAV